ncbi:cell wall-binding repeat-containing protein [Miniphocaeibacter massiliensis]|uniref:cell wall-binding repeat-containing protein n=1 Tax=Miniphocaeibacter massiliensis TaxID=2041841 RepID=UPI000C072E5B|nr:cell wall-binding repeat-containing protein [Miniphocaeibacter massiliensis]
MYKVTKKFISAFLAAIFVFLSFINLNTTAYADETSDYLIDGKEVQINGEMTVYSEVNKIKEDSVIEYVTEDNETFKFESQKVENSEDYYFIIRASKSGIWKAVSIDGVKVKNDILDFKVYTSQEELEADYPVEQKIEKSTMSINAQNYSQKKVNRYSGANRYATAVKISKDKFSSSKNVIITSGIDYPDALSAVSLSKQLNAPILFADKKTLPSETKAEIKRLGAKKVFVIGGDAAVNNTVFNELKKTAGTAERIAGANRTGTAVKVAKKTEEYAKNVSIAILVSNESYADALSSGPVSGNNAYPILFSSPSNKDGIDDVTKEYIKNNVDKIYIVGGTASVGEEVDKALKNKLGKKVERIVGSNRYDTSIKVSNKFFSNSDTAYLATGSQFADALAGGAAGAKDIAPMYLVDGDSISDSLKNNIKNKKVSEANILGGTASVSSKFENSLKSALGIEVPVQKNTRDKIVEKAKQQLGIPYKYGGSLPSTGFDCSGFVKYVFKEVTGKTFYHKASEQAKLGKYVSKDKLQPGDLLFFNGYGSTITHTGIYIGNNQMIHSPKPGRTVEIVNIKSGYYSDTYHTSRNVID